MLWPEGSQSVVANLGEYLNPALHDEPVRAFVLSKLGSYLAIASKSVLAMYRLKPLVPLSIYPTLFADAEIEHMTCNLNGEYIAVSTNDGRVSVFMVGPQGYLEERLKFNQSVTPGPGEAIGAQEIRLDPLDSVRMTGSVSLLGACGPFLLVANRSKIEVAEWRLFGLKDPLNPPEFKSFEFDSIKEPIVAMVSGVHHKNAWLVCFVTASGKCMLVCYKGDTLETLDVVKEECLATEGITSVDYNPRLRLLALGGEGTVTVYKNGYTRPDDASVPIYTPKQLSSFDLEDSQTAQSVKWTPSGVALLVGFTRGWQMVSMLGLVLYSSMASFGVLETDFYVGSEAAVLRDSAGCLRVQNMLRASDYAPAELTRPVLFGNNRLMLYHDPSARGITEGVSNQSWLTIPLPTWYMAQNWPLNHVCSTSDGRFVAIAGTVGVMIFSVASRQWKEVGSRDFMVRGGMCWFGRRLVASCRSVYDDCLSIKMFSPAMTQRGVHSASVNAVNLGPAFSSTQPQPPNAQPPTAPPELPPVPERPVFNSAYAHTASLHDPDSVRSPLISSPITTMDARRKSAATLSSFGRFELQVLADEMLGTNCSVLLVAKGPDALLGVVFEEAGNQLFLLYNMVANDYTFHLLREIPLQEVLGVDLPVVRSVAIINENEILLLEHSTLYLIKGFAEQNKYERRVIAEPIEMFEYLNQDELLCVFDGAEAVFSTWPLEKDTRVATINLDAFPVHFSSQRGVVALVEVEPIPSFDGSFVVARPMISHEVYIHYLLEAYITQNFETALTIATKYSHAPYFAGVLENLLYHCVRDYTTNDEIKQTLELVKRFPNQNVEAIVANCARKIDMKYWKRLFSAAGEDPQQIFDTCLARKDLKTAAEILIVVQTSGATKNDEPFDLEGCVLQLYLAARDEKQFQICRQVCQYILSVDAEGTTLRRFRELIKR